jgi:hypothetical protein
MPLRKIISFLLSGLILAGLAHQAQAQTPRPAIEQWILSAGIFNIQDNDGEMAGQITAEYRGESFWYNLKPTAGLQLDSDGAIYAFAGGIYDVALSDHWYLAPSIVAGLYKEGDGKNLGHSIQFRSAIELAYQTENFTRYGISFNHMSNGRLGKRNPGAESLMLIYGRSF